MTYIRSLYVCSKEWFLYLFQFLQLYFKSSHAIKMENIALVNGILFSVVDFTIHYYFYKPSNIHRHYLQKH